MLHGIDINKTRLDDLDREILRQSLKEPFEKKNICNFGSGESRLSLALLALGHSVYSYDSRDLRMFFSMTLELYSKQQFIEIKLENIKKHNLPKEIDIAVAQRVLHYLTYADTQKFLCLLRTRLKQESRLYISLSGIDSQLGRDYTARNKKIEERMGPLDEIIQKNFNITEPVCLYSVKEARELVESIEGLEIEKIWTSQFGNIKVVIRIT